MSFKVKDLAMNVSFNVADASTCSTWTRQQTAISGCGASGSPFDVMGTRPLDALRVQLRQVVSRA